MKLLVTGGAGYIGSVVTSHLLAAGHDVVVLDDLSTGHRDAVPEGAGFVDATLLDVEALRSVFDGAGFDGVVHFAAKSLVAESVAHPELYWRNNVIGSFNLLEAMRAAGVPRLVFSSTAATYGEPTSVPIRESDPTAPTNPYGASKLAVDMMLTSYAQAYDLAATSLRYFNVAGASGAYGERHTVETHLIPLVLQVVSGDREHATVFGRDYPTDDGSAVRDYIHVDDLARAHLLALEGGTAGTHAIYNLGNGTGYSVLEVIDAVRRVTGHAVPAVDADRRTGDPAVLVAAGELIAEVLGWKPEKHSIDEIVSDAWRFAQRGSATG